MEDILLEYQVISNSTQRFHTAVKGDKSKFRIWRLRSKAVSERIELNELAQVLFAINKKRGYKSNRKANDEGDGQAIEGMEFAEILFKENLTPGELLLCRVKENKKGVPQFYRSDLIKEVVELFKTGGVRGVELGSCAFSKKDPETGAIIFPELELVRLTVSRRVYTNRHMDVVVNALADVYQRRDEIKGLRITYQGPIISLRHFTAKFEQISD